VQGLIGTVPAEIARATDLAPLVFSDHLAAEAIDTVQGRS